LRQGLKQATPDAMNAMATVLRDTIEKGAG
jgi:hypothetical protein